MVRAGDFPSVISSESFNGLKNMLFPLFVNNQERIQGGILGVRTPTPPPFLGAPKTSKRGKNVACVPQMQRVLVLNS